MGPAYQAAGWAGNCAFLYTAGVKWVAARELAMLAALSCAAVEGQAAAQDRPTGLGPPAAAHAHTFERAEGANPWSGSTMMLEQSVTTQTANLGVTPQSYVPLYELWLSLRPRYWFGEHVSLRGRVDYTKELTNSQPTTLYRQDVFGDIWTDLVYAAKLDPVWRGTRGDLGLRAVWPTSQASEAAGIYIQAGLRGGLTHEIPLRGADAATLASAHVALRGTYAHAFSSATTPTDYGTFAYTRQNVDEFLFVSDQITGQTLASDSATLVLEGGLQITPRLSTTAFGVVLDQWHYAPTPATVGTTTGAYTVPRSDDQQFTQSIWIVASVDYLVLDELELGVGYYNLANSLAPDGRQRGLFGPENVWWSPDARVFFSLTANLDVLYDDASRRRQSTSQASR
jgi:hypothetical protein